MELEIVTTTTAIITRLHVCARPRYWEDATVDGVEDESGDLIPCRNSDAWRPVIELASGRIENWKTGVTADIHYKVCDDGEYWLSGHSGEAGIGRGRTMVQLDWAGDYVPDDLLCIGDTGYGDYIIFQVDADGQIHGWEEPSIDASEWKLRR